jgi:hypothetical protein
MVKSLAGIFIIETRLGTIVSPALKFRFGLIQEMNDAATVKIKMRFALFSTLLTMATTELTITLIE